MVSTCSLFSKSSRPITKPLEIVTSAPITIGFNITNSFLGFFVQDFYLSFRFLLILLCGVLGRQSPQFGWFSFFLIVFVDYLWSPGPDWVICNLFVSQNLWGCLHGILVYALDYGIVVRESNPSRVIMFTSDKYLWEGYEPPYPPSYKSTSTTTVLLKGWIWH